MDDAASYATHEVSNQAAELADYNAFTGDVALQDAVALFGGRLGLKQNWKKAGRWLAPLRCSNWRARRTATSRNCGPMIAFGNRIDEVEFHPAWHELMGLMRGSGYHSLAWSHGKTRGAGGAGCCFLFVEPG